VTITGAVANRTGKSAKIAGQQERSAAKSEPSRQTNKKLGRQATKFNLRDIIAGKLH
jgi:hypothetical protein